MYSSLIALGISALEQSSLGAIMSSFGCARSDGVMRFKNYFPDLKAFKDEGEVVAAWAEARLIKYLDGKLELKGGSKEDRIAAREWISMFLNDAVVREG